MDTTTIFFTALLSIIIWAVIVYSIISSATRSKKIENHLYRQSILLSKMAKSAGVDEEEIKKILTTPLP